MTTARDAPTSADTYDEIASDLNALREEAGGISYAEIVRRIARRRIDAGQDPVRARPARTTVYDAFRTGRARMNAELVHDIVLALGADEGEAREWRRRAARARKAEVIQDAPVSDRTADAPASTGRDTVSDEAVAADADRGGHESPVPPAELTEPSVSADPGTDRGGSALESGPRRWVLLALVILAAAVVNELGGRLNNGLHLPLYLDMIGTGLVAMGVGFWPGAAVAVLSISYHWVLDDFGPEPFLLVTLTGAALWSAGIRRWGMGRTIGRYFLLQILVAVSCTLVAVPINIFYLHGHASPTLDTITSGFTAAGFGLDTALFLTNISTSIADKLITGFISLVGLQFLHVRGLIRVSPPSADGFLQTFRQALGRLLTGRRRQG